MHKGSFHEAVAPVLTVAQCFCLMPVLGIGGSSVRSLHFSRKSWRFWYSCLYLCSTTLNLMFSIRKVSHGGLDVRSVGECQSSLKIVTSNPIARADCFPCEHSDSFLALPDPGPPLARTDAPLGGGGEAPASLWQLHGEIPSRPSDPLGGLPPAVALTQLGNLPPCARSLVLTP